MVDPNNEEFKVLFLFFSEKNEMFLLLGREENTGCSDCSKSSGSLSSEIDDDLMVDSEKQSQEEQDDDSPYFVKITLDSWFLSHLEEPAIVESSEIPGQYEILMSNKVFREIIAREVEMMFGVEKKKEESASKHESSVHKISVGSLSDTP